MFLPDYVCIYGRTCLYYHHKYSVIDFHLDLCQMFVVTVLWFVEVHLGHGIICEINASNFRRFSLLTPIVNPCVVTSAKLKISSISNWKESVYYDLQLPNFSLRQDFVFQTQLSYSLIVRFEVSSNFIVFIASFTSFVGVCSRLLQSC